MSATAVKSNRIKSAGGLIVFLGALSVYLLCLQSSVALWDCPEYLLTAMKLEIGHPPGNPFWTLVHRVVTMAVPPESAALAVNAASAMFSALAALLLYLILFDVPDILSRAGNTGPWIRMAASSCGALMFAWCDSVLYSAVEVEVYSMSIFLTALTMWLMKVWYRSSDTSRQDRILLLAAYLAGLSVGVHQLNLLVIPAVAAIIVYKRRKSDAIWMLVGAMILSLVVIALILKVIMPLTVRLAALCELVTVNSFGWPYFSGAILFVAAVMALMVLLLWLVTVRGGRYVYLSAWSVALLLTGYSCYAIILIRGVANPPVNEGAPDSVFALERYINREQYGSRPLLYGKTPFSRPVLRQTLASDSTPRYNRYELKNKGAVYARYSPNAAHAYRSGFVTTRDSVANASVAAKRHGYVLSDYRYETVDYPELDMWLPRIVSSDPSDLLEYASWAGADTASMTKVAVSDAIDSEGNFFSRRDADGKPLTPPQYRPTYLQNITYFGAYQAGYMYFRYLMWNFSGRQNDIPSTGEANHGNFITGIPVIDDMMLGPQKNLPDYAGCDNRGRNAYFLIPLLLCLAGLIWLLCLGRRGRRLAMVSGLLFILTGLAIVVYLNQTPCEPRERDYSFLGSFFAFSFWGGCGAYALASFCRRRRYAVALACVSLAVPAWMIACNYDDHCRRGRHTATAAASNILRSLPRNTILFVDGDNFTFPLWYAVEGLGIRPDVRIINVNYLAVPSYINSLTIPTSDAPGVKMTAPYGLFDYGRFARVGVPAVSADTLDATVALRMLYASSAPNTTPQLPSRWIRMGSGEIVDLSHAGSLTGSGARLTLRTLAMLDIVATARRADSGEDPDDRPIAWLSCLPERSFSGLSDVTVDGYYVKFMPSVSGRPLPDMPPVPLLSGGADDKDVYIDPDAARHVCFERMAAIRCAERLADRCSFEESVALIDSALSRFSPDVVPLATSACCGKTFHESERLGALLIHIGAMIGEKDLVMKGRKVLSDRLSVLQQWRDYRDSLPVRLRPAVAFATRRDISRIDSVRALLDNATQIQNMP